MVQTPVSDAFLSFDTPLLAATFLARPNRFIAEVALPGLEDSPVRAHVADPGRLKELLIPGVPILIKDHGATANRKLRYSLELVRAESGHWVSVNTMLPNRLIAALLASGQLPGFEGFGITKREVSCGESRVDFLLNDPTGAPCWLEIKSCTLVVPQPSGQRLALFPDAPTVRGTRHIRELIHLTQEQHQACRILFVIQRADADCFSPNRETDPALADALRDAIAAGVTVQAYCFELTEVGCRFIKEVPVVCP
jgi:sugar fermentation stimulation protein A